MRPSSATNRRPLATAPQPAAAAQQAWEKNPQAWERRPTSARARVDHRRGPSAASNLPAAAPSSASRTRAVAGPGKPVVATAPPAHAEFTSALDALIAKSSVAGLLPHAERLTMHARQAGATERQLTLCRLFRAVEPRAPTLTEMQLRDALAPLARFSPAPQQHAAFLGSEFLRAMWRRAGSGSVQGLLDALCPIPVARGSIAAADGQAAEEVQGPAAQALRAGGGGGGGDLPRPS